MVFTRAGARRQAEEEELNQQRKVISLVGDTIISGTLPCEIGIFWCCVTKTQKFLKLWQ